MNTRTLRAGAIGALVLGAALTGWQMVQSLRGGWAASAAPAPVILQPAVVDPAWVRAGQPNFRTAEIARSPDGRSVTGVWACDGPSTFEWRFDLDETVYVLDGRVEVSYLGRQFVLMPGQSAVFKAGTRAVWHVPTHLRKVFKLHHPGRLALWWQRLVPAEPAAPAATVASVP